MYMRASLVTQMVKNPPTMQETWIQSLWSGRPPEGGHGSPLQGQRSLVGCSPWVSELDMTKRLRTTKHICTCVNITE